MNFLPVSFCTACCSFFGFCPSSSPSHILEHDVRQVQEVLIIPERTTKHEQGTASSSGGHSPLLQRDTRTFCVLSEYVVHCEHATVQYIDRSFFFASYLYGNFYAHEIHNLTACMCVACLWAVNFPCDLFRWLAALGFMTLRVLYDSDVLMVQ